MKQEELQQVWQERSQEAFVQVAQWQQEHPSATLAEIEETMDRHADEITSATDSRGCSTSRSDSCICILSPLSQV